MILWVAHGSHLTLCGWQGRACRNQLSPSTVWDPGVKPLLSHLTGLTPILFVAGFLLCECGISVPQSRHGGQRAHLDVGPHLSPYLTVSLFFCFVYFFTMHAKLATLWDSPDCPVCALSPCGGVGMQMVTLFHLTYLSRGHSKLGPQACAAGALTTKPPSFLSLFSHEVSGSPHDVRHQPKCNRANQPWTEASKTE